MLSKPTVFVIGAGASHEAKLPTGDVLRGNIASMLDIEIDTLGRRSRGRPEIYRTLLTRLRDCEGRLRSMNDMLDRAWSIRDAMPQAYSIDTYLDSHRADPDLVFCGKVAIAKCILGAEAASSFAIHPNGREKLKWDQVANTFYPGLWNLLAAGVDASAASTMFENVTFIVFNYDRCLELFLFEGVKNYFRLGDEEARNIVNRVRIWHPYGTVGKLPWQLGGLVSAPFGADTQDMDLGSLAEGLSTFTEKVSDTESLSAMLNRLSEASLIVMLGFAYHPQNMELLAATRRGVHGRVLGTALNISDRDLNHVEDLIYRTWQSSPTPISVSLASLTCAQFFAAFERSLRN